MSLPGWLEPLPDAGQQQANDAWAIEERGIAGLTLMERAATGLAELTAECVPHGRIAVVCGKGNNGGDGLVAARLLRERGREVDVLLIGQAEDLHGDARTSLERLPGPPPQPFSPPGLEGAAGIVDALLGTGFSGAVREPAAGAITAINQAGVPVVACDGPSGVDASTGEVEGAAVQATATATFAAAKPGLWIAPGKSYAGQVRVVDIGIPPGAPAEPKIGLLGDAVTDALPRRGHDSSKFAAGSLIVCGGSTGLTGAPSMAAAAAMRAGAGYVTLLVPNSLNLIFEQRLIEVMSVPLPDDEGKLTADSLSPALERAASGGAVVVGPGLGRDRRTQDFARALTAQVQAPVLLDADGLNAHAGALESLRPRPAPTVLSPHAGELGRLLQRESSAVQARRLHNVRAGAAAAEAIVILKGDDTLVADPSGTVAVNPGGSPALATAGTGDVLSGIIGAYLSKGVDAFHAACAAVYVHAEAGRVAAEEIGEEGVVASDVSERLPHALSRIRSRRALD